MSNGWTGGQYSVFRVLFGTYLLIHFSALLPWGAELFSSQAMLPGASASPLVYPFPNLLAFLDAPGVVSALLLLAMASSLLFLLGAYDRWAVLGIWFVWACLFGRNPLSSDPSLVFVGWLLLAHALLPSRPYGSWARRGDPDPGTGWRMPDSVFAAAWVLMALAYSYSGYAKLGGPAWLDGTALVRVLESPLARPTALREVVLALPDPLLRLGTWGALGLELGFAPLALLSRLRPILWTALLGMHLGLALLIDFADLSLAMALLHLFTFNPSWLRPARAGSTDLMFYDGACALCHAAVRFVLAEDRSGTSFRFAPLESDTFRAHVPEATRAALPDSIIVVTADERLLTRSTAVLHLLGRLGGLWRLAGVLGTLIPRRIRDGLYDGVASIRYRVFGTKQEACPLLPAALRQRFEGPADSAQR